MAARIPQNFQSWRKKDSLAKVLNGRNVIIDVTIFRVGKPGHYLRNNVGFFVIEGMLAPEDGLKSQPQKI